MAGRLNHQPSAALKNACDACHAAKVKCSQGRPQCKRCDSRGLFCQYSVSMRSAKHRRPPCRAPRGAPNLSDSTTLSTSNYNSPAIFDDASLLPPSAAVSNAPLPFCYDPLISSFEDNEVPDLLEDWSSDLMEEAGFPSYSEDKDGSTLFLSRLINTQQQPVNETRTNRSTLPHKSPDNNLINDEDSCCASAAVALHASSTSTRAGCNCQGHILSKLSELMLFNHAEHSRPFDQCLSENRKIVTLCNTIINCPNNRHGQDTVFMLTSVALVTHVLTIFDRPRFETHQPRGSKDDGQSIGTGSGLTMSDAPRSNSLRRSTGDGSPTSGSPNTGTQFKHYQQHPQQTEQPFARVRLSLGSYQLDQSDEQILKINLLKIELSKVEALIDTFEKRFCSVISTVLNKDRGGIGSQNEPKLLDGFVVYLKRRLKANYELLASLAEGL